MKGPRVATTRREAPPYLFRSGGIHTETQVEFPGIGIVDFLLEGFLIVEIDGGTQLEPRQVKKEKARSKRPAGT
ncbi:hypothetical protein ARTHRO9AX_190025 [Arthrobacter sp. 9AX]|nr:hypothetical protein ARTHRO9AX_190025 [Arthrobacter sp. 9AX]